MTVQPVKLLGRLKHAGQRAGRSDILQGGTSGPIPDYMALVQDDFRTLLRADLRVRVPELCSMLELRSLTDGRSVYFHPPTATILVYDRTQSDATLTRAHDILQRRHTPRSRLTANQRIDSIEYYATGACNLRCGYCYLGPLADRPETMDLNPAGFLDRFGQLLKEDRIAPRLSVAIIGGEPLLAFDGLRHMVTGVTTLAQAFDIDVSFGMTTNGHLLDEEMAAFLRAHHVAMKVSCDGHYDVRNRPGKTPGEPTYGDMLSRLRRLTEGMSVTLNATLLPAQFEAQREVFAELIDTGFSRIQISVANGFPWTAGDFRRFFRGLCALTWEEQRRGCQELQQSQVISILREYKLRQSHCGAGISHLAFNGSGDVEACSTSFNKAGHGRQPTFGLFDVDHDPACAACAFRYACGGGCRAFRDEDRPCITDCAPIYLRFILAMGIVADLPGFHREPERPQ